MRLFSKIALIGVIFIGIATLASIGVSYKLSTDELNNLQVRWFTSTSDVIMGYIAADWAGGNYDVLQDKMSKIANTSSQIRYLIITDAGNRIRAHTFETGVPPVLQAAMDRRRSRWEVYLSGNRVVNFSRPIGKLGSERLHIGVDQIHEPIWKKYFQSFYIVFSLTAGYGLIVFFVMGRRFSASISQVVENLKKFGRGTLVDNGGYSKFGHEMNELNTALSAMMAGRTQLELNLVDSENQWRTLVDNIMNGIFVLDNQGNVKYANQAAKNMFLNRAQGVISQNIQSLIPRLGVNDHGGITATTIEVNGVTVPVEVWLNRMSANQEFRYLVLIYDTTEKHRVERLKEAFVTTISHELRTPLSSLRGSLSLLTNGLVSELPENAMNLLDIANKNVCRLGLLVEDLLDFRNMETGMLNLEMAEIDLMQIVDQTISNNSGNAERKKVLIRFESTIQNCTVRVDEDRMHQVMNILLSNAIKYSPRGGEILVSVDTTSDSVCIRVRDHGPGIPEHFRNYIFDGFSQLDAGLNRTDSGMGLGLSIAHKIVEQHRGKLDCGRDLEDGAEFILVIPVCNQRNHTVNEPEWRQA